MFLYSTFSLKAFSIKSFDVVVNEYVSTVNYSLNGTCVNRLGPWIQFIITCSFKHPPSIRIRLRCSKRPHQLHFQSQSSDGRIHAARKLKNLTLGTGFMIGTLVSAVTKSPAQRYLATEQKKCKEHFIPFSLSFQVQCRNTKPACHRDGVPTYGLSTCVLLSCRTGEGVEGGGGGRTRSSLSM